MEEGNKKETKPAYQKLYVVKKGKYFIWYQYANKGTKTGPGQADVYCFFESIFTALKQKHEHEIDGNIPYNRA